MARFWVAAALLCVAADSTAAAKVRVRLWGESGCPYTQRFIYYLRNDVVKTDGLSEIMEFEMYPFGNAYYITPESLCGGAGAAHDRYSWGSARGFYDIATRRCYNALCGLGGQQPHGCYSDGPYCQHGEAECALNAVQACASEGLRSLKELSVFVYCIQRSFWSVRHFNVSAVAGAARECAGAASVDAAPILECFADGRHVRQQSERMARATPPHPGVPHVDITNRTGVPFVLRLPATGPISVRKSVCAAWAFNGGADLPACTAAEETPMIFP